MESVLRGAAIYLIFLVVFRVTGRRPLAKLTSFDFVLLLIVAETAQQALLGQDYSITNAALLVITLLGLDCLLAVLKHRLPALDRWVDGLPVVVVEHGRLLRDRADRALVDVEDVLTAARELQGIERLDQIRYAILERNGAISVIPESAS